ncbi:hypothetical protein CN367_11845 [Priestia megaterium]|uniref:hypothetical protein n=1 Tax=Priestia megaterium TaxID=1404 RepID=UPI000BF3D2FF|nr:hypothetical protein [Priestia megaterium]PEZ47052.1 hypothetical protein CN367_11845 [Priestia megaterium]
MPIGTIFFKDNMKFRVVVHTKINKLGKGLVYESSIDIFGFTSLANGVQKQGWVNLSGYTSDIPDLMHHKHALLDSLLYME